MLREGASLPLRLFKEALRMNWLYGVNQFIIGLLFWFLSLFWFRLEIKNPEYILKVPRTCIFVPNHKSYVDHFLVVTAFIRARCLTLLPVRMLIRRSIYYSVLHPFLFLLGTCPTAKEKGHGASLKEIDQHLKEGGRVGIYPEGKVVEESGMANFHRGIGVLIQKNPGKTIVPIAIYGTFKYCALPLWRSKVTLAFGAPFVPDHTEPSEIITEKIRKVLSSLYEPIRSST